MSRCNCKAIKLKKSLVTKCVRCLVLCVSISCLFFYVYECYIKLKVIPEVLVNEKLVNSWTIPFPAVTICAPLLVKSETLNLSMCQQKLERRESLDKNDLIKLIAYAQVCPVRGIFSLSSDKGTQSETNQNDVLDKMSLNIDEILNICLVDKIAGCKNIYIRSLTDLGYCFSFNMVGYHSLFNEGISKSFDGYKRKTIVKSFDYAYINLGFHDDEKITNESSWTLEKGYPSNVAFPNPLPATRGQTLITRVKIHESEISNFCESRSGMITLYMHLPNEIPTMIHLNHYYKMDRVSVVKISAEITQNDETLKGFDLNERGCYFEGEHNLKYFKSYTKLNCEYECLINFTYAQCECVKLSMPRTESMRVCELKDISCYQIVEYDWPRIYFQSSLRHETVPDFQCGCMPSCTQIRYKIVSEISVKGSQMSDDFHYSAVRLVFDESQIIQRTNYVTYKLQNFVSDIGGLIGLFLGFSLLSLFELLLKACSYLMRIINGWIRRLKRESQEASNDDGTLTEVITVQEFRCLDSSEINQNDSIFIIPGHVDSPLEIEDLEDY